MKREMAERMAATEVEGVTVEAAQKVVATFLQMLGTCQVCGGTGLFVCPTGAQVTATFDVDARTRAETVYLVAGPQQCPQCHGVHGSNGGDPEYVRWECLVVGPYTCSLNNKLGQEHDRCGLRVMVPWEPQRSLGNAGG